MAKLNKYPVIKAKTVIEVLETADSGTKMALERGSRYVPFEVRVDLHKNLTRYLHSKMNREQWSLCLTDLEICNLRWVNPKFK